MGSPQPSGMGTLAPHCEDWVSLPSHRGWGPHRSPQRLQVLCRLFSEKNRG